MIALTAAAAAVIACAAPSVLAWSSIQHQMTGQIAQAFIHPEVADILTTYFNDPLINGSLPLATVWADKVKNTKGYSWSKSSHYVDAEDVTVGDPNYINATATACKVEINEVTCPNDYCVPLAILNYTDRADIHNSKFGSLSDNDRFSIRAEAARFLAHYIGDITQPLHNCGRAAGGNFHLVKWNGSIYEPPPYQTSKHNLHFIWDQFLIDADVQLNYGSSYQRYVDSIVTDIRSGIYNPAHHTWTHCETPVVTTSGRVVHPACPLEWSNDANDYNCDTVWANSGNGNDSDDLFTNGYYAANKDVARLQLAKAGLRLATVFNSLIPSNGKPTRVNIPRR